MLVTSITALARELLVVYIPGWPASAPLAVTAVVVLAMTVGILGMIVVRWVRAARNAHVMVRPYTRTLLPPLPLFWQRNRRRRTLSRFRVLCLIGGAATPAPRSAALANLCSCEGGTQ